MAIPKTREEVKQYCLRRLGHPVIEINVDDRQIDDRIDDAIAMFQEYHFDGSEQVYLKHKITATTITFSGAPATAFVPGEPIVGSVSNAKGKVFDAPTANTLRIKTNSGTFQPNENVIGVSSGAVGTIPVGASNVVIGDIDKGGFAVDPDLMAVTKIHLGNDIFGSTSGILSLKYQAIVGSIGDVGRMDLINYSMVRSHMALIDHMLNGLPMFQFNRLADFVHLTTNWDEMTPDTYVIIEGIRVITMTDHPESWWSIWFVNYLTALIKQQWGTNLKSKFQGLQLPGGHTVDGQTLYNEATQEISRLELQAAKEFQEPPRFFMG